MRSSDSRLLTEALIQYHRCTEKYGCEEGVEAVYVLQNEIRAFLLSEIAFIKHEKTVSMHSVAEVISYCADSFNSVIIY